MYIHTKFEWIIANTGEIERKETLISVYLNVRVRTHICLWSQHMAYATSEVFELKHRTIPGILSATSVRCLRLHNRWNRQPKKKIRKTCWIMLLYNLNSRWCMGDVFEENGVACGLWLSAKKKLRSTRSMDLLNFICLFLGHGISVHRLYHGII